MLPFRRLGLVAGLALLALACRPSSESPVLSVPPTARLDGPGVHPDAPAEASPAAPADTTEPPPDAARVTVAGVPARVWASSTLPPQGSVTYEAANAFDGDRTTAWVEGAEGLGDGEALHVRFDRPVTVEALTLVPGYTKNPHTFTANAVPRSISFSSDTTSSRHLLPFDVTFHSNLAETIASTHPSYCRHTAAAINVEATRIILFGEPRTGRQFSIAVRQALPGHAHQDVAVSEVVLFPSHLGDGGAAYAGRSIIDVLRAVSSRPIDSMLAPDAYVEDLRTKQLHIDPGKGYTHSTSSLEHHFFRVPADQRCPGESVRCRFLAYVRGSFVGNPVVVHPTDSATVVTGYRSHRYGSGEWAEFYPQITIAPSGAIASAVEKYVPGAAPGCPFDLFSDG
jgi:hypothetical protein